MAPEASEKIENAPGDTMPGARQGEDAEASSEIVGDPPVACSLPPGGSAVCGPDQRPAARPQTAQQSAEIVESAPDTVGRSSSPADRNAEAAPLPAACGEAPSQNPSGPEPANLTYVAPDPFELAPVITVRAPTETPGVFRMVKMRMVRNGMMACG